MLLTKAQYLRGLQCIKSLWLFKNKREFIGNLGSVKKARFAQSFGVLDEAKKLFADGRSVQGDFKTSCDMTLEFANLAQTTVIYGGVFFHKDIAAEIDILVRDGDSWQIIEVKSGTSMRDYYIDDVSVQYYGASAKIQISRAFVMYLNSEFMNGDEPSKRFIKVDVTDEVIEKQKLVALNLAKFNKALLMPNLNINIGGHCEVPFECDFRDYCFGALPNFSIFELLDCKNPSELYAQGMKSCYSYQGDLTYLQEVQLKALKDEVLVADREILNCFVTSKNEPMNFLRFGTFNEAIPSFEYEKCFCHVAFGFSLDIVEANGQISQKIYIGDGSADPRTRIIKELLTYLNNGGDIYVYKRTRTYEILNNLALFAPVIESAVNTIKSRIKAFDDVFESGAYYDRMFKGDFSFTSVLSVIAPNLNLSVLGVKSDDEAGYKYLNLPNSLDKDGDRADLANFLSSTTFGMRMIFERFKKCANS